jgi:DNA repair exonuclease SbcCD ATPase subunit
MNKKFTLEKKIRDAAVSLAKVNASHKSVSKQSTEQLEAANRKVETVQKELWRISERSNEIMKKLLEHRAGVLSISVKNLEAKVTGHETDDSGYGTSSFRSTQMSPTSSEMSHATSSFKGRFEGPHLFAGHADAVPPMSPKRKKSATASEITALEEKLRDLTEKLKEATEAQQTARRELSHMRLEKAELETTMGFELQSAEDTIASLEDQLKGVKQLEDRLEELEYEREEWEAQNAANREEVEALERRLEVTEEKSGETVVLQTRLAEMESALERLREVMMAHGVVHNPREGPSFMAHLDSLETHLENLAAGAQDATRSDREAAAEAQAELERRLGEERRQREEERRRWEDERMAWEEQRLALQSEAQALLREREEARREARMHEIRAKVCFVRFLRSWRLSR